MVYYHLSARVTGTGISQLIFPEHTQFIANFSDDYGEERKNVTFDALHEEDGIRDIRNLSINLGGRKGTLRVEKVAKLGAQIQPIRPGDHYAPLDATSPAFQTIALFDVRNMNMTDLRVVTFDVKSPSGHVWQNISPHSEFSEWDDKSEELVFLESFETKVDLLRKL